MLSTTGDLYALRAPTLERRLITRKACLSADYNSMAVSREGGLLVGLADGSFQAMDATLACSVPVPVLNQRLAAFELLSYGMTFVGDGRDGETLFLSLGYYDNPATASSHLATLDPSSNEIRPGAQIATPGSALEIAGTDDGRLYGYQLGDFATPSSVVEVDPETGAVIEEIPTGPGLGLGSMALAVMDDAVYAFGSKVVDTHSYVVRIDRTSRSVRDLGSVPFVVTGAGASSCAARAALPSSPPLPSDVPGPEPR